MRLLCIGKVVNGGPVQIDTGQTLEERLDAAIAHTAEVLAMSRDLRPILNKMSFDDIQQHHPEMADTISG